MKIIGVGGGQAMAGTTLKQLNLRFDKSGAP